MPRTSRLINPFLLIGMIGCFTCGSNFIVNLFQAYGGPDNIWWTHNASRLELTAGRNHFQLFIAGERLDKLLADGRLMLQDGDQPRPVQDRDLSLRLNNWPEVKNRYLGFAVFSGSFFGLSLGLLIAGLVSFLRRRKVVAGQPFP